MMGEKIRKGLLYLEWTLAGVFLSVMTSCVFLEVLARYVLHLSLSWPEEVARFSFIWVSLLGASIAMERKKLHEIDIVFEYFPIIARPFIAFVVNLFVIGILSVFVFYGTKLTALVHLQVSPAMEIRMSYVYSAIPFTSGLMLISQAFNTIETFFQLPFFRRGEKKA
ncbi:MAG: TRAP transporter small permease subunit [Proteobacteria bacterium]|nr:TRAP transporter small permease subunit [Pseudomonadota bacterium]